MTLPRLYAITDTPSIALALIEAGVTLLQYRNKQATPDQILSDARLIRQQSIRQHGILQQNIRQSTSREVKLIMNDRADLCLAAGFDGVHVGADDISPESARAVVGKDLWVGVSTHNQAQVIAANQTSADYIAIGPIFATASKTNPDPVIGLEGLREARALTSKPLVAIGGITLENCRSVMDAGADVVAVIAALRDDPAKAAERFLRMLN